MLRRSSIVLCCFLLLCATPVVAQESGQGDDPAYVVQPGPGSAVDPEGVGYFVLDGTPGRSIEQSLGVRNDGKKALTILLAPVDAATGQFGGVSYGLETAKKRQAATWIDIEESKIILKAGESVSVPFSVSIPKDAGPGVHLAGISAYVPGDSETVTQEGDDEQAGAAVVVRTRRILAVQVEVPGERTTKMDITGVEAVARPDGVYLEVALANVGTELTKGSGQIELADENFAEEFLLDTFVPGTSIAYPIRWRESVPNGEYGVTVRLEYEPNKVAEYEGTFTVGDQIQDELDERQVGGNPNSGGSKMTLILIAALIVLIVIALYMRKQLTAARNEAQSARERAGRGES